MDNSKHQDNTEKTSDKRNYVVGRNKMKWNQGTRSGQGTRKRRQSILERKWDHLYGQKNLCTKQSETMEKYFIRKP